MKLNKHIAYRFLTDDSFMYEILGEVNPNFEKDLDGDLKSEDELLKAGKVISMMELLEKESQTAYWITNTVLNKLDLLKVKKKQIGFKP